MPSGGASLGADALGGLLVSTSRSVLRVLRGVGALPQKDIEVSCSSRVDETMPAGQAVNLSRSVAGRGISVVRRVRSLGSGRVGVAQRGRAPVEPPVDSGEAAWPGGRGQLDRHALPRQRANATTKIERFTATPYHNVAGPKENCGDTVSFARGQPPSRAPQTTMGIAIRDGSQREPTPFAEDRDSEAWRAQASGDAKAYRDPRVPFFIARSKR